jgi:hypothetical protein
VLDTNTMPGNPPINHFLTLIANWSIHLQLPTSQPKKPPSNSSINATFKQPTIFDFDFDLHQ